MIGLLGDLPAEGSGADYSDIGAGQRSGATSLTTMESVGDVAKASFFGATRALGGYIDYLNAQDLAKRDRQFNVDPAEDPAGALIDPKEWTQKYPDLGLTFTPDMGQAQAQLLVDHRQEELRREYILDHSPNTLFAKSARTLTEFALGAVDPVNVAAVFVPGIGETRAGLLAAKFGKTLGRVIEGGVAGATGMAALQPLEYAESQAYQDHYGPMEAFANIAFGAALGGGLHAGFGKISDFFDRASPETREAALRGAVANLAEGRPVDVEPILAADRGLAVEPKFSVAEPGKMETMPVINRQDFELAGREAQLQGDIAQHDQTLGTFQARREALPPENPEAVSKLRDVRALEDQMKSEELPADARRLLGLKRDELLTNTNPETLAAQAKPTFDRQALEAEQRGVQARRDASARMLAETRAQRTKIAADAILGPYARSAIDRARQNSLDYARGKEQGPVTGTPQQSKAAAEMVSKGIGDDHVAELADAEQRLQDYRAQGIISDEEHAVFNETNTAASEAAKTKTDAAAAAARCLFLHP